ncbi:MAG: UvrB/UvrC motif-containing protein [Planctomycetaceae bacterium]|nr:UvrB/UvrC motif-containing protein [Planctomycetaceae bacterium]
MSDEREEHYDIDRVLQSWPFKPGVIAARLVRVSEDREVLQMRIEMGVLQMEVTGRPDGEHPGGADNCLEWLQELARSEPGDFTLTLDHCVEIDRELVQFYHRRICFLALRQFAQAVVDADYILALMDFAAAHSPNPQWTMSHEQYRPLTLFHRTQAAALMALEQTNAETAIETINQGLEEIRKVFVKFGAEEQFDQDELIHQLAAMKESLRQEYRVGKTLAEQLADAVAAEEYERAARLRDEIARHHRHEGPQASPQS